MRDPWEALKRAKITRKDRLALAKQCLENFRAFCRLCEPPAYDWDCEDSGHAAILDECLYDDHCSDGRLRSLLLAPRGGGKSSLKGQRYAAWRLVRSAFNAPDEPYRDGSIRILYITETAEKAAKQGEWLTDTLKKSNVTRVFGTLFNRKLWGVLKFTVKQRKRPTTDPSFTAVSPKKSSQGGHYDVVIPDDVVTLENTGTLERMDKLSRWFMEILAQLDPGGEVRACGTPHSDYDLYARWASSELWHTTKLTVETHKFPNLTPEFLAGMQEELIDKPEVYSAYYLCEPFPSELRVFNPNDFLWIKAEDLPDLNIFLLADVGSEDTKQACQTAFVVIGVDGAKNYYILDIARDKWRPDKQMSELHRLWTKWNPLWGGIENRTLTQWFSSLLRAKVRETGTPMHFETAARSGYHGKLDHIRSLQRWFAAKEIYFVDTIDPREIHLQRIGDQDQWRGALAVDLERFPRCKYPDLLDALAYMTAEKTKGGLLCPPPPQRRKKSRWQANRTKSPWIHPRFHQPHTTRWKMPLGARMGR